MTIQEFLAQALKLNKGYVSVGVDAGGRDGKAASEMEFSVWIGEYKMLTTSASPELTLELAKSKLNVYHGTEVSPDMVVTA